uniref:Retrotransposon protein, putative, Ty1-copia subclass n=1 Tax=Oryza sativa subsp. japonica TaxID=39947 RepID=Q10II6_ORYSJ|nr:retrotransposon protein, putative, Ty1-copia subclass [Oryza sativa Japonica Group]
MAAPTPSNFNLWSILEKEKLTGTNFLDWYHNLRIVLRQEHKEFVLTQPFPADLPNNAPAAQCREHERRCNEYLDISCLMLATMSPELQRQYEALNDHTIITGLRNMFEDQARAERLAEGNPVSLHVIKMIGYTESLDKLGFPLSRELATDLILQSLPPRILAELHGMLKTAEESIKKNSNHVMVMHKRKPNNKKSGQKRKLNSHEITSTSNSKTKTIKYLRSDRGGEYLSLEFGNHLKECGIVPQLTPPGTPQWNGVSERRNPTLLDMVRSMMSQTDLPLSFWGYAPETVAFTLNRVPSKSVDKTPYEIWTGKRPSLSFLKIWGCEINASLWGYPKETKGYYFYNREEGKVFVARHGVFLEKEFISRKDSGSMVRLEEIQETPENDSTSTQPQQAEQDVVQQVE